jgi:Dolichyl-phosphate-mannose-protein mannosyltransferase
VGAVVAAVAIVVLAAGLRLWRLDLVEFKGDESTAMLLAEDLVRLGKVPLVGAASSVGIQNPPLFLYFLAPIVNLTRDPAVASGAVGLANVAGVAGLVLLAWRNFSPLGGLAAGLAYATNPWAVFYARKVWNPDVVAPLAILYCVALEQAVTANGIGWAVAAFPIFAVGVQMHFSFGFLGPLLIVPTGVLLLRRRWIHLGLGISLALLTAVPDLVANYQSDWPDLRALQHLATQPVTVGADGQAFVLGLATSWDYWYVLGIHLDRVLPGRVTASAAIIQTALVGLGLGVALAMTLARGSASWRRRWRYAVPLLVLGLPALLTVRPTFPLFEHYYVFVPPAAALLIAAGFTWLARQPVRWGRPLLGLSVAGLMLLASIHVLMVVRLLDRLAIVTEPTYGAPLVRSEAVAREVVGFGARSGSQHLVVELRGPDSQPLGYLARPYFPELEVANLGEIGLGPRLAGMPASPEGPPAQPVLGPLEQLDLRYGDGVEVLSASTVSQVVAADRVGLAITWVMNDVARATPAGLVWEVALYDPRGAQLARQPGIPHDLLAIEQDAPNTSWFTVGTEPSAAPGRYEVGLRRIDPATAQPLPFVAPDGQTATEWRSPGIEVSGPPS